ncbi:MAG: T9SS type A sorting domain-containing protein [Taibaiella sp.]|nr:T9SS type A sorting domain-containing protein [Taibaiella sp.]
MNVAFGSGPIKPFKLNLPSGGHQYNLYGVTMQGPPDTLEISYTLPGGRKCFFRHTISPGQYTYPCTNWPSQKPGKATGIGSNTLAEAERIQTGMIVYPNPANQSVTINYNYGEQNDSRRRIVVYDMIGRKMKEIPVTGYNDSHRLDVASWTQGVYILRMEENGSAVHTMRVTITH